MKGNKNTSIGITNLLKPPLSLPVPFIQILATWWIPPKVKPYYSLSYLQSESSPHQKTELVILCGG